jgi:hypothetical protein
MKRIAAFALLGLFLVPAAVLDAHASHENRSIGENSKEAKRASKQYRKYSKKQAKQQRKLSKKYQKAQKRAAKRHH